MCVFAQGVATEYKGDVDVVTVADRTVEKLIRTRLGQVFPEHGIYGEEERATAWIASSAGMWIPWMGPRISRTDFRSSACRWGWNSATPG